jgi:hypothetical protein
MIVNRFGGLWCFSFVPRRQRRRRLRRWLCSAFTGASVMGAVALVLLVALAAALLVETLKLLS